jgi:DNA polymerase-1
MSLYAGVQLPGRPDLANIALLDRLPIPMITRMQRFGIAIDIPYLHELTSSLETQCAELAEDISSFIPRARLDQFVSQAAAIEQEAAQQNRDTVVEFNAASAEQVRVLLFHTLGIGKGRRLKRTATGEISTGKRQLEMCREDHPVVGKVLAYRERAKLKSTYTSALPRMAKYHPRGDCPVCETYHAAETWRLHSEFPTTRAATGRLASRGPNLQNIPIRTELGQAIRAAFIASPGMLLVSVDWSQMELRNLAHLSHCGSMINAYKRNEDIHDLTARACFGLKENEKPDKTRHRLAAKRANFSIQNGTSADGLLAQLVMDYGLSEIPVPDWLTKEWCAWFIVRWLEKYEECNAYFELQHYRAKRYRFVWDSFGGVRPVPEVMSCHYWKVSEGLRQAQNLPITALNAGQMKLVMGELQEDFDSLARGGVLITPLLSIHDQLIAEVAENHARDLGRLMQARFNSVMDDRTTGERLFDVPIQSDCEIAQRWIKQ